MRYRIFRSADLEDAWTVENLEGLQLGTLRPAPVGNGYTIYYGPRLDESLGRCLSRQLGAQILGFYRQALIRREFFREAGRAAFLHERLWRSG